MALLEQKTVLLAKIESSYGVDPTLVAADGIIVQNPKIDVPTDKKFPNFSGAHTNSYRPYIGKRKGVIDVTTFFYTGLDAGDVAPRIGRLFKACGMQEVQTVGTKYEYKLATAYPHDSLTLKMYKDGLVYRVQGARGKPSMYFDLMGGVANIDWHFEGIYSSVFDGALITPDVSADPGWATPPKILGATVTIGSYTNLALKNFRLDIDNVLAEVEGVSGASGIVEVAIVSKKITGKMTVQSALEATNPLWTDYLAATGKTLSIKWGTTSPENQITLASGTGTTYITNITPVNDNGVMRYDIDFHLNPVTGDDGVVFTLDKV